MERIPVTKGKKAILFCTHRLWKGSTLKIMEKQLASKGYEVILSVSKRGMSPDKSAQFLDIRKEIGNAIEKRQALQKNNEKQLHTCNLRRQAEKKCSQICFFFCFR
jgi:hypothetical protein